MTSNLYFENFWQLIQAWSSYRVHLNFKRDMVSLNSLAGLLFLSLLLVFLICTMEFDASLRFRVFRVNKFQILRSLASWNGSKYLSRDIHHLLTLMEGYLVISLIINMQFSWHLAAVSSPFIFGFWVPEVGCLSKIILWHCWEYFKLLKYHHVINESGIRRWNIFIRLVLQRMAPFLVWLGAWSS